MNIDFTLWPNPDGELGVNKVTIPTGIGDDTWPEGDALINNVVYKDGKISGFVDTKALIANSSNSTTFPYDYVNIQVDKSLEGVMTFNKGERTKYFTITYTGSSNSGETFDFVIIDFNSTDTETINTIRTAKRVVDNKLYDADDNLIGTIDTSKIEVGGVVVDEEIEAGDGLFCNLDSIGEERRLILSEFNSDLSSLRDGIAMFTGNTNLTSFNVDLPKLTNGDCMFALCSNLTSFNIDLPNLTDAENMFFGCSGLNSFTSDLSNLTNGLWMFTDCISLSTFNGGLPNLTNGWAMFKGCKLDTASVQNIANTIKDVTSLSDGSLVTDDVYKQIYIGIGNYTPNDQEKAAIDTIVSKGWTVFVNGSNYTPSAAASIMTLDENVEEVSTPIPFYAKPVEVEESKAKYISEDGKFYRIQGAQFIYGDDLSTYGMFTCEEDAAINMGLTKIEKPSITSIF